MKWSILDWLYAHEALCWWLGAISIVTFVGSILAIPWLVARIPADYFLHRHSPFTLGESAHLLLRFSLAVLKNLLGILFILLGIAMLVLPGQGVIIILIGLIFLDFPGKFALERRLIEIAAVHQAVNWIRGKSDKPPLDLPNEEKSERLSKKTPR